MNKLSKKISGWINFYKPAGISSNKALLEVKKSLIQQGFDKKDIKIGYLGTLDPFAQGLLPIALGEALKTIQFIKNETKSYEFIIKFGATTETLDNTKPEIKKTKNIPSQKEIKDILSRFVGDIKQIPPIYSAIKINGERSYRLASKGEKPKIKSRKVKIFSLKLLKKISNTEYKFFVKCGKGTYIRTLASDMAISLSSLGYLTFLERTENSIFNLNNHISLDFLKEINNNVKESNDADSFAKANIEKILYPIDSVLDGIPVMSISENEALKLKNGLEIPQNNFTFNPDLFVRCLCNNELIAICSITEKGNLKAKRGFN